MRDHTSLLAWQRARKLVLEVHHAARSLRRPELAAMIDQLRRSALSVQLNITEGYARRSKGYFSHHLTIAYGSVVEARDVLELLLHTAAQHRTQIEPILITAKECGALTLALKRSVERPKT